jgi:hypothetical protein
MPMRRSERFQLEDGLGRLRVEANDFEQAVWFDSMPLALLWNDNEGSVGQLLSLAGHLDIEEPLQQLRRIANGQVEDDSPIWPQIYPLLQLLENGTYGIHLRQADRSWSCIEHHGIEELVGFYPMDDFVMTRPEASLDRACIDAFERIMAEGVRPLPFCLRADKAYASFILDGHHKLRAYARCNLPPWLIEIVREHDSSAPMLGERRFFANEPNFKRYQLARRRLPKG